MNHCICAAALVWALHAGSAMAANTPPVVDAGNDSTIQVPSLDLVYNLWGFAEDDGLPNPDLVVNWTRLSGPTTGLEILYPDATHSLLNITTAGIGIHKFKLTAFDGQFTVSDSVTVTIIDSLPFLVLTPRPGAKVMLGDTCTISWQFNQNEDVVINLSTDDGKSFEAIQENRTRGKSWLWHVADSLPVSDVCRIMVKKYRAADRFTVSERFSLIAKPNSSIRGIRVAIAGRNHREEQSLGIYTPDGRLLGTGMPGAAKRGVVIRRIRNGGALKAIFLP